MQRKEAELEIREIPEMRKTSPTVTGFKDTGRGHEQEMHAASRN